MLAAIAPDLVLRGKFATLEPLALEHAEALSAAAADGKLWELNYTSVPAPAQVQEYIETALENKLLGLQQPFAVRRMADQKIVGCTRYYDIERRHQNLAIGYTWYAQSAQRTAINTQCKILLLEHAFAALGAISVAFHTHHLNFASQAAIARLGASKDGVLRSHRIMSDGSVRDTWCYSITAAEWPAIKAQLQQRLV